jgi:GNAT superfamily N-acetyltransferase
VLLAEAKDRVVGFLFAIPDLAQAARGQPIDTMIAKSMAVLPEYGGIGLGGVLMERAHAAGRSLGFRRSIHALMHQDNRSRRLSSRTARVIRRYTLYERLLRRDA